MRLQLRPGVGHARWLVTLLVLHAAREHHVVSTLQATSHADSASAAILEALLFTPVPFFADSATSTQFLTLQKTFFSSNEFFIKAVQKVATLLEKSYWYFNSIGFQESI